MLYCSPANRDNGNLTCFKINSLRKMAAAYNAQKATNYKDKIKFNASTSKQELWDLLRDKLSSYCKTEWCWLDLDFIRNLDDEEIEESMLPKGPAHGNQWLKTTNINATMKQYEKVYPGFVFFGPVPIDFADIHTELNNLDLKSLYSEGVKSIGIVFNMDPHTQNGSHWVCMYVDLIRREINYFDSFGICPPPKQIQNLVNSLNKSASTFLGAMTVHCSKVQHQQKNSECGVYCMYFITEALKGRSFNDISTNIILDDEINKYRPLFYRPSTTAAV